MSCQWAGEYQDIMTMSAYIVDKNHILYLVSAAANAHGSLYWYHDGPHKLQPGDYAAMADTANMLWRENIKSVSGRYPNESSATLPGPRGENFVIEPKDFSAHWLRFDPIQVLKACACYGYQSCEHEGWETSGAYSFIANLKARAISALPGYDAAIWGAPAPYGSRLTRIHA